MVVDFSGKSLSSDGMTALEVIFGSCRRPTIFMVVPSQASFNILLGREWIHGVGIVPLRFIKNYFSGMKMAKRKLSKLTKICTKLKF